ncbi:hypothetical protein MMC26_006569 [Xylographa opegraphella]|nr:hypothetical protein [Xylographa opegraphella]
MAVSAEAGTALEIMEARDLYSENDGGSNTRRNWAAPSPGRHPGPHRVYSDGAGSDQGEGKDATVRVGDAGRYALISRFLPGVRALADMEAQIRSGECMT